MICLAMKKGLGITGAFAFGRKKNLDFHMQLKYDIWAMKIGPGFLFVVVLLVPFYDVVAQEDEICAEHGIINTEFETPLRRFNVVFGRIAVRKAKGDLKAPTIAVWLREGRSTQRHILEGSGSYCFRRSAVGGEITVDVNGQEAARRPLSATLGRQREDFEFNITSAPNEAPPGVISAKFNYKRSEKNEKLFEKALKAEAEKKPEEAIEYLNKIVKVDAADYIALAKIGDLYYGQKRFSDAEIWFSRSVAVNPEFTTAWVNLAQSQYALQKYESAIESCKKVFEIDPRSAEAFYVLGKTYLRVRKGNLAIDALNNAIRLDPRAMAECHLILANLYDINGLKKLAAREYKLFLEKVPNHAEKKRFERYIKDNS